MNRVVITGIDTSSLPKLSMEQSNELLKQISNGDENAREIFLQANIRLVLSILGRFSTTQENVDDLFQAGMVGLIKSLNNFDPNYGVCFSTYAVPMIMGEIKRFLRDRNGIKVPRSMRDIAYKALKAREILAEKKGVTVAQIALAWIFSQDMSLCALSSPVTEQQIYDNIKAMELKLSIDEVNWLNLVD